MKLNVVWRWGGGKGEDRADLPDVVSRTGRGGSTTSGIHTFRDDYQGVHLCSPSSPLRELSRQVTFRGGIGRGDGVGRTGVARELGLDQPDSVADRRIPRTELPLSTLRLLPARVH